MVVPGQAIAHTDPQCKLWFVHGASNMIFQMYSSTCAIFQVVYLLQQ